MGATGPKKDAEKKVVITGLAKALVQWNLLTEAAAEAIIKEAQSKQRTILATLMEQKEFSFDAMREIASREYGIPNINLSHLDPTLFNLKIIKKEVLKEHKMLPFLEKKDKILVAIADPNIVLNPSELNTYIEKPIEFFLADPFVIDELLDREAPGALALGNLEEALEALEFSGDVDLEEAEGGLSDGSDEAPVVRYINKVLIDALNSKASDIHFEPYEKVYRIRMRRDGILVEYAKLPLNLMPRITTRLKVLSKMDISERRIPQDGRFKLNLSRQRGIDFRVSACPTLFGEKVVTRILDPASASVGVDALGFEAFQKELFLKAIQKPQGMVLVTGPTGSGKTVSLYTALSILNTEDVNITTCEDPIEINLSGINQVNVNVKSGLTFSAALRSFLRQDPDIIMVGEIRDLETAEIAVKAAQTGHLVLSTLHTNSAPDTLTRLINMGIPSYNLATSVHLVVAQRLARRLCVECRKPLEIPKAALLEIGFEEAEVTGLKLFGPSSSGCNFCQQGYKGRLGIYQVMPISGSLSKLIMEGANAIAISDCAKAEGIWDLRRAGLHKVKLGLTSLEEINRIIQN